jgi:hypothetical protein
VDRYGADGAVTIVDDDGTSLRVTPRFSPELQVEHACGGIAHLFTCTRTLRAPLGSVQHDGLTLSWPDPPLPDDGTIALRDVESAAVLLPAYDRPGWRPTLGVGGSLAGAAGAAAISLHWLAQDWLAFEVGALPPYQAPMLGGYLAFRLRPLRRGEFAPFVGWFVNGFTVGSSDKSPEENDDGVGPRLGLDWDVRSAHVIVTVEADLVHPFDARDVYFGQHGRWVPWGGGAIVYYF